MMNDRQKSTYLSKSLFIKGLQCPKSLYLHKFHPELRDDISESQEAIFQSGFEVGKLAQTLFPGGVEIPYVENDYAGQVEKTKVEIEKGAETIFEATFSFDNIFVKADILRKGRRGWELYEVKSSTEVKDVYIDDIAVQYYVLTNSGIKVSKASVAYINNKYVRSGDLDVKKLFTIEDITAVIKKRLKTISSEINAIRMAVSGDIPVIDIGLHCSDPYDCDFSGYCRKHLPENSVFDLCGSNKIKFALHNEGFYSMDTLPVERLEPRQRFQVEVYLSKKEFIDKAGVKSFLESLSYPLCFFDFETFQQAIPPFDGTRPYQKIPFQYSLHVIEKKGAKPKHFEFLAEPDKDPREEIAKRLVKEIPDNACVLAYHKSFETEIINNLKGWFPQYAKKLDRIIENMKDLKDPFKKRHVYHWQMQGSASLKVVLPSLVPSMTYSGMQISHGGQAQEAYFTMQVLKDPGELKQLRKALLEYCKLDTLAMVKILEKLKEMAFS